MNRASSRSLHLALVGALLAIIAVFGSLFWLGTAPLLRDGSQTIIGLSLAVVAIGPILLGWFWARPQIPLRPQDVTVDSYWLDPEPGRRAMLVWVLWEGSATICAVGTLLSGSLVTALIGLVALALLLTHGPGYLEGMQRTGF